MNNILDFFIGEKITIKYYPDGEENEPSSKIIKGILINFDFNKYEATILRNDGCFLVYELGKNRVFIDNHENIGIKILNTPKPKKYNKFENIDV
jgi:hypothetical protein